MPFTVWAVLFGAEEVGLVGIRHYVSIPASDERRRVLAMLNVELSASATA